MAKPKVLKEKRPEKIEVTLTELLMLQNTDRSRADVQKWWQSLQHAERIVNPNRSSLYDLYERIKLEPHLKGIVEKRVSALLNKKLHYQIGDKRVEELEDLINSEKFRLFLRKVFDKKLHGITGLEFLVSEEFDFKEIQRKHIKPEVGVITIGQNDQEGYAYKDMWNILVLEDVERFGLYLSCCPSVIYKTGSKGDLAQYIELYGQPMRVATYDGDDPNTKASLRRALEESGGSLSVIMPSQAKLEIKGDHVTNGNGEVHKVMFQACNNDLSVLILGNTETTSNDNGGSNAKSKEHGDQQLEITKSDLTDIELILSSKAFKVILKSYGYPVSPDDKGKFVYEKEIDLDELKKDKEIDAWLGSVVPLDDDYYYEKYGRPKPKNYEALKKKMEAEKAAKEQPVAVPPKSKKAKPLADDLDYDFDPEDSGPIVKQVITKGKEFLSKMLGSFFH